MPVIVRFVGKLRLSTNRVLLCIAIALVAHVPFLPFSHLFSSLFHWGDESESDEDGEALMPLELDLESGGEASKKLYDIDTPPPSTTGTGDATEPPPDAGPPPDAETADAGPPDAAPDAAADGGPDAATPDAGPSPPKDPVADLPVIKQITKNPNNVQIVLVGKRLREHPVGAKMGTLLPTIPQWSAFFDGSGLDPVNDVDVMVITGPQMKVSGQVIAFVQFNIEADRIHDAVDKIRQKTEPAGAWLEDMPLESAHATADRAERVFAVIPEKKLLCVFPWPGPSKKDRDKLTDEERDKSDKEALKKTAQTLKALKALAKSFPDYTKKDYAIDVSMIEPYKLTGTKDGVIKVDMGPLPALSFEPIPRTLKKMHLVVTPKGGDADVKLSFEASDVAQGERDLESLKSVWPLAQTGADMKLGLTLPDLDWQQNGTTLEASTTLDEASLEKVYALGEKLVEEAKKRRQKKN
ncbi:MAG TPA: hypothetical protein VL400_26710 [Polyangiaceae bacterium]|nr:hypothetical protein [Polyangiaceae bacterium]